MRKKTLFLSLLVLLVFPLLLAYAGESPNKMVTRRFAMVVGANDGGAGKAKLQYAVSDAESMRKVLEELGGILPDDTIFLAEPSREAFFAGMKKLQDKIIQNKEKYRRTEIIFYYSGHSDENHILLGTDKVSYQDVRDAIHKVKADVRIAILDSCMSGTFAQLKGGKKKSPFLMNVAYNMKGYAFMTSSSSDEASQESDRIKGSFFTHNLISGMRGAADVTQDGRITLNEAYQHAFTKTLTQTEKSMSGPQHPHVNIQMSGTGDVVITDITSSSTLLVIDENIAGNIFIFNNENVLALELTKPLGRNVDLGLEAGKYRISNFQDDCIFEAKIDLKRGKSYELMESDFTKTYKVPTYSRGTVSPQSLIEETYTRQKKFQIELFGGFLSMDPADLNLRALGENLGAQFYQDQRYTWWYNNGYIQFYGKELEGQIEPLKRAFPFGLRLKYRLTDVFSVSLGFKYVSKEQVSQINNIYTIVENGGYQYQYTYEKSPFSHNVSGYAPLVGIHFEKKISRLLGIEGYFSGGPLFANCQYTLSMYEEMPNPVSESDDAAQFIPVNIRRSFLKEKGKGTGYTLELGTRLNLYMGGSFNFFIESGYALQRVHSIRGPGTEIDNGVEMNWEGNWGVKEIYQEHYWGDIYYQYPSNYWGEEEHRNYRLRDFHLDLSGFQIRIGISRRF